jgi:hypothetical protein
MNVYVCVHATAINEVWKSPSVNPFSQSKSFSFLYSSHSLSPSNLPFRCLPPPSTLLFPPNSLLPVSYLSLFTGASKVEVEALRAQVEECEGRLEKGAEYVDVLQAQIDEMTEEISNMKRAEEVCY